jgi:hypothetical protein
MEEQLNIIDAKLDVILNLLAHLMVRTDTHTGEDALDLEETENKIRTMIEAKRENKK